MLGSFLQPGLALIDSFCAAAGLLAKGYVAIQMQET